MKRSTREAPVREIQYLSDKAAMLDMAAAFGQGACEIEGGDSLSWSLDALLDGKHFLARRLAKKRRDYWTVRAKALRIARLVGRRAASYALEDAHKDEDDYTVIERLHFQKAIANLRDSGPGASREECPF